MKIETIPLSSVNLHDTTFFIGSIGNISVLKNSINEVGLLTPPSLIKKGNRFQILSGWKRISACKQLSFEEILSKVYEANELTNQNCLRLIYHENQERLTDPEKAEIFNKFRTLCCYEEDQLFSEVFPMLGISPSRKNFEKYMSFSNLENKIKNAFFDESISYEQFVFLSEVQNGDRVQMLQRILLKFKLNKNETREITREIRGVALRDSKSIGTVIDELEAKIDNAGRKDDFRHELKKLRYPSLTKTEDEFKAILKDLNLPKELNFFYPPYFEGNNLEIRLKFNRSQRLSEIISYLFAKIESGEIEKLMNIVREGKP